jgi:anti-anti-sigma regulatory factor
MPAPAPLPPAPSPPSASRSERCYLTPYLYFLPQATLAATIIVAVVSLIDLGVLRRTWVYSRKDFAAVAATILVTLAVGVEAGVLTGVTVSLALFLYRTSRPHMAVVGLVPGTEHFRNVLRHEVRTSPHILSLRVDESLYFANARYLEDKLYDMVAQRPELRHVILMCTAVNEIDASALESLEAINQRLDQLGVAFHLSEVKGPVMDQLQRSDFLKHLTGQVFLSQYQAIEALDPALLVGPGRHRSHDALSSARGPDGAGLHRRPSVPVRRAPARGRPGSGARHAAAHVLVGRLAQRGRRLVAADPARPARHLARPAAGAYELWRLSHGVGAALVAGLSAHHTLRVGTYSEDPGSPHSGSCSPGSRLPRWRMSMCSSRCSSGVRRGA